MKPVNVFLIEDNPADVELVREALHWAELEHPLEVAADFEQAKSGIEGIRLGVPVIVVSSSNVARDRDQAAELGAVNYFRKPTDLDEFLKLGQIVAEPVRRSGLCAT